jgi:glycerol-3-phosphate dehydrogenase
MGTAFAMHSARAGLPTSLWANEHDLASYASMRDERKHPLLPEHLPDGVELRGPNELEVAARDVEIAVMAANSAGARSLASMVREHVAGARVAVSVAKGLEPATGKRMSEVYSEEIAAPTSWWWAGLASPESWRKASRRLRSGRPRPSRWPRKPASRSTTVTTSSCIPTTSSVSSSVR